MDAVRFEQCDFHTHTDLSGEAQARGFDLEALFRTADELGLRYVGYSEHWHLGTPPELFLRIRDEVERLQAHYRVKVFVSAEIDVLNSTGDLACDVAQAAETLDYVCAAISHYGASGVEQLEPDLVDDTVAMIEAVCRIPEVTMLMHPQIVYGRCLERIAREVPADTYAHVMQTIAAAGKVVDYPSVQMSMDYLEQLGFGAEKLSIARAGFDSFTTELVRHGVRLAPGSDAHHVFWSDGVTRWFGENAKSYAMLQAAGFRDDRLWFFDNDSQADG